MQANLFNPLTHPVLTELLDANRRFALNAKGTTNHCPMALIALAQMGADAQRLRQFFNHWEQKYALPAPAIGTLIARTNWRSALGETDQFEALQACFEAWIMDDGIDAILQQVFSSIPFAPATGAFHGLIRLAYGLEAAHTGEMAAGLAYMVIGHLAVNGSENGSENGAAKVTSAAQGLATLSSALAGCEFSGAPITGKLRGVAADPRFIAALPKMPTTSAILEEIAHLAIAAYWQTKDFTVLHMVTASHAARLVFARLPADWVTRLLPQFWNAVCAAYVSVGAPALTPVAALEAQAKAQAPSQTRAEDWPKLFQAAVAANNDHVIKMSYTCYCENLIHPSPLYFASAKRLVAPD